MAVPMQERPVAHGRHEYIIFVDDREIVSDISPITGGQIMDMAGIPRETGLIELLPDGTQQQVSADESFELHPGRHFKKAPRFKRG